MDAKAFLFDMDGVLVDNCAYHVKAWLALAEKYGGRLTAEQTVAWMGAPGRDYIARMFDPPPSRERADELLVEKEALYREIYRPHLVPREGLARLLSRARAAGVPCAIATGGSRANVDFVLDGLGMRGDFECVVDSSQYVRGKPAPDCYLQTASRLGVAPADAVVFEDAVNGIQAAQAAGMRVAAITGTFTREALAPQSPTWLVDSFDELLDESTFR